MSFLFGLIFLLIFLAFLVTLSYLVFDFFKTIFNALFSEYVNRNWLIKRLNSSYENVLNERFSFYQNLNTESQQIFRRRLQKFIDHKTFVPKGTLESISPEMKTLIGASAIQMTFGLPHIYLAHFREIHIYPDIYQSKITGQFHQGEVNTKGIIVLSWKSFVHGYFIPDDGRNLGLHEMAHALKVEDMIRNDEFNFLDRTTILRFISLTRHESRKILHGKASFFREYAASNDHEFFAIVIENFFERPKAFKEFHQELYHLTTQLLRQDPLVSI